MRGVSGGGVGLVGGVGPGVGRGRRVGFGFGFVRRAGLRRRDGFGLVRGPALVGPVQIGPDAEGIEVDPSGAVEVGGALGTDGVGVGIVGIHGLFPVSGGGSCGGGCRSRA